MSNYTYTASNLQAQQPISSFEPLIHKRNNLYKSGLAVSCVSFILFFFGDCGLFSITTLSILGKIFFFIFLSSYCFTIGVAVYENFRKVNPYTYHSRKLEISLFITGILGIAIVVALRATEWMPLWFFQTLIFSILSLVCLFVGFFLVLCGNKKPSSEPTEYTVQFTTGIVQNTAMPHSYGMPMLAHQYTIQSQPLLPPCVNPQSAPPQYFLPPSYPALYPTPVAPGYNYLPPSPIAVPTAPLHSAEDYYHSSYRRPQLSTTPPNATVPSAPQLDDKD